MSDFNYSFELHEFEEALTPYGTIETRSPSMSTVTIDDFTDGEHFRTGPDEDGALQLELENRLLTLIVDESGSMTWNDNSGDRYTLYKRLLGKLNATYPGVINANLLGFGGVPTKTNLFLAQAGTDFLTSTGQNFNQFLQETFQDSVFDFAGVRIVRRTDRFPNHPADGVVVAEGIVEAIKDENLTEGQNYYYGVWTFNKDLHFSQGQFIKGFPTDRVLPHGVNLTTATPRILPGVERDDNTVLIYNFVEGGGFLIFDSSGSGYHGVIGTEVIEDNFWTGDAASSSYDPSGNLKKAVGVRFDGEFDIIETDIDDISTITPTVSQEYVVVNFWIYRYDNNGEQQFVIGTSPESNTDEIGWAIGVMASGKVGFTSQTLASGFTTISNSVIPEKEWTMVSVIIQDSGGVIFPSVFINGQLDTAIIPGSFAYPTASTKLVIGAKITDSGSSFTGTDFFGSLNLISIHNTLRSADYLSDLYNQELNVFEQSSTLVSQNPADNRQREVLLTWDVSDDFNFSGGQVKILRKYNKIPSHIEDGDLVVARSAEAGQFFYMDTFDFINGGNYYYRIFTINSLGNICDRSEARVMSVKIQRSINEPADPSIESVSQESITEGNHKVFLQWANPYDSRWRGTRIYFSTKGFPTVSVNQSGSIDVSDGTLVTDTTRSSFVHRIYTVSETGVQTPLVNGITHYYTIITYDKFNRISEPKYLVGVPSSQLDTVFPSEDVEDLHLEVLNPGMLSVQWINPTVKSEQLDLFFGESSLIFVNVKDIYGGNLDDITNLKLQVCTSFRTRGLKTNEVSLGVGSGSPNGSDSPLDSIANGGRFGSVFDENCNTEQEEAETVLTFANVESGLIKGLLTHTNDRQILARRQQYTMDVRAQYKVTNPDDQTISLFEFNTGVVRTTFTHPIRLSIVNKLRKFVSVTVAQDGGYRGEKSPCECPPSQGQSSESTTYNGGYARSTQPYIARVEIQYKGEALPDGTPIRVNLFKHGANSGNANPLSTKSDRTFIREGIYISRSVLIEELNSDGNVTGRLISKSIVDVEIKHPQLADFVDLYITVDYLGFFVDAVHEIKFIDTLFIELDVTKPSADGIDVAEQFATAWSVNPDDPNNPDANIPVADGTIIKWELVKLAFAKERPFYSTETLSQIISGVYSSTLNGVAHNVFFGPVGNVESHHGVKRCGDGGGTAAPEPCCIGEQYAIKANVIVEDESATDAYKFFYPCPFEQEFTNKRFLMNADPSQPFAGGPSQNPHWVTWGDGIHMLKFQIAKNPAISDILGADCFRICVENEVGGQLFQFPDQHIVQISAEAEILWNVSFDEDPYTGTQTVATYESVSPKMAETLGIPLIANIPIIAETTDFYVRLNTFVGNASPTPQKCESGQGGLGDNGVLPCEWKGICQGAAGCTPVDGRKWNNVQVVSGTSTLIAQNREITLLGGGDYSSGIPPIYIGFREPLSVRVIDARINGARVNELIVDGISQHTFTVEVTFANEPVPDGTPIELVVSGEDQDIVLLSSCINSSSSCRPGSGGVIYTRQVNDPIVNPQDSEGSVPKRSLAYFSIDPLPDVSINAQIDCICRYDKLGTVTREVSRCIEINNTINVQPPDQPPVGDNGNEVVEDAATSNEAIVYDTIKDLYQTTRGSSYRRMGHFAVGVSDSSDFMYLFGGLTGNGDSSTQNLTPRSEKFNLQTQQWEDISDMQTPRAYGQAVSSSHKIYLIGGIELDALLNQYIVSRKIESFDIETELWNTTLAPMPEDYGVAFGNASIVGDYIYVSCGVTSIQNSSQPDKLNDRILRYSIIDDEWTKITPSNDLLYKRIAPFGWYRSAPKQGVTYTDTVALESSGDDVHYDSVSCIDSSASVFVGTKDISKVLYRNNDGFFRFQINIPKDTTIVSASMTLYLKTRTGTDINIQAIDADNVSTDICGAGITSSTATTGVSVFWPDDDEFEQITPDIAVLIQQFIERPNYSYGNYIVIKFNNENLVSGPRSPNYRNFYSYDTPALAAVLNITYAKKHIYTYAGSIPKLPAQIESERNELINKQLDQLYSFLFTSQYYNNLPFLEQESYRELREKDIIESVVVPAFVYPATGFKFLPGTESINVDGELEMDISDTLDDEWKVLPLARDYGQAVYIPRQDSVYLMGGSNQNQSTTLNRVEMIDLGNDNEYTRLTPFSRGRSMFGAVEFTDEIYLTGGLTSGHSPGFVEILVQPNTQYIEARGMESGGLSIILRNDSGEIINDNIRVDVRGRLRLNYLDDILINFLAARGADRALGGTGAGDAPGLPGPNDQIDLGRLTSAQNKIIDPNSDQFQFNAARKLNEEVSIFPILYSSNEFVINGGVGGVTLLPRSEDPLTDFQKLAEFIKTVLSNTPENPDERFTGDLTREELAALGDVFETVKLPPTIINSGSLRELYTIETKVTILDPVLYGQSVSQFDIDIQDAINSKIEELLTPPTDPSTPGGGFGGTPGGGNNNGSGGLFGGSVVEDSQCFLLQHVARQDVPDQDTGPGQQDTNHPGGVGGFSSSGQCLFCQTIIPTNADVRHQLQTVSSIFYNIVDWMPQIKKRLIESDHTLQEVIDELDIIDHEVPFGSSQLYNAMFESAIASTGEELDLTKKVIYIASDNSQNLSLVTRDEAIDEINSIDGNKNVPVVYTVFSTSFPISLSAQLQRSQVGDVEKIVDATRGQATTLIQSTFIDQILNITLGGATGGLGYGIYTRQINLGELSAITQMVLNYTLPSNTQGFMRFRSSSDGFNFTDFSERFEGSGTFDFVDFFAKIIEIEVVLTTGFTVDITEEYDSTATGIPKLLSLTWDTSSEREDFMFLNKEDVLTNAQQVAMAFEGDVPTGAIVELGVATSESHDWRDFQSDARPAVREFGKTFLLERTNDPLSVVPIEPLVTVDGRLYATNYGPWDPNSNVTLYEVNSDGDNIPVLSGFVLYPRDGQVYFDTKQPPTKLFKITIINDDSMRVGIRFRNRLFNQSISMEGVGYIYSTNDEKPVALSQVAPRVTNVQVSPRNPTAGDTFFALYNYIDLNNDKESGTIISWFKNGVQLLEIQNKVSWTNDNLLIKNKLVPNDRINFQVIPSDGRDYGVPISSPIVIINAREPGAEDIRIVPYRNGIINDRYDTSSVLQVQYNFETDDQGAAGVEDGTIITWFVNGQIFKQGTFSGFTQSSNIQFGGLNFNPAGDPKILAPSEINQGVIAHQIGNQIQVEVTPKTLLVEGKTSKTDTITVENSIAIVTSVKITPEQPTTQSTLRVTYELDDFDISSFNTQTDQSEIRWFQSTNGTTFSEITELVNSKTVPPFYLRGGNQWKVKITPYDGLDLGSSVESSAVVISP